MEIFNIIKQILLSPLEIYNFSPEQKFQLPEELKKTILSVFGFWF